MAFLPNALGAVNPFIGSFPAPIIAIDTPPPSVGDITTQPLLLGQVYINQVTGGTDNIYFLTENNGNPTWTLFGSGGVSPMNDLVIDVSLTLNYGQPGALVLDASKKVQSISAANHTVLMGRGANTQATFGSIVGGAGITVGTSGNNILITANDGFTWQQDGTGLIAAVAGNGYENTAVGVTTVTLPAGTLGQRVSIIQGDNDATSIIKVEANAGATIFYGNASAPQGDATNPYLRNTLGANGLHQMVEFLCQSATAWIVSSANGNWNTGT